MCRYFTRLLSVKYQTIKMIDSGCGHCFGSVERSFWRQTQYECDDAVLEFLTKMKICANDARKMVSNKHNVCFLRFGTCFIWRQFYVCSYFRYFHTFKLNCDSCNATRRNADSFMLLLQLLITLLRFWCCCVFFLFVCCFHLLHFYLISNKKKTQQKTNLANCCHLLVHSTAHLQ